jgi:hypothetical protein
MGFRGVIFRRLLGVVGDKEDIVGLYYLILLRINKNGY